MKKAMAEQQTMIETNVGSLAVRERGEGRPAVLWHSLFIDERSWQRVEEDLQRSAGSCSLPVRVTGRVPIRAAATRWRSAPPLPRVLDVLGYQLQSA
jgi:hypothetical protein